MIIKIKIIVGKEITESQLEVSPDSTVFQVKELIEGQHKFGVYQQKLLYKGRPLPDRKTLDELNITDGSLLYVLVDRSRTNDSLMTGIDIRHFWDHLSEVLHNYYSKGDTIKIIDELKRNLMADVKELSLDDIQRLAKLKTNQ